MEKPPVGAGTSCTSPALAFYIPPCRKCLPAWRTVKYSLGEGQDFPAPTGGFSISRTAIFQRRASLFIFCIFPYKVTLVQGYQETTGKVWCLTMYLPRPNRENIFPPLTVDSGAIRSGWRNPSGSLVTVWGACSSSSYTVKKE